MPEFDHDTLLRLLDLQEEDSAIRRLEDRRASLPEAARLAEVRAGLADLDNDLAIAIKQDEETGRAQHRLEGEIESIEEEIARDEQRLFAGGVSNPKELAALQAKVGELRRKKSGLEDALLEVMEQKERTGSTRARLQAEHDETTQEAGVLQEKVGALTGDIEGELSKHSDERERIAATLPQELLDLYERIRGQKHGVGAAALEGGACQGCHTKLPAVELEEIKSEGGLHRCENCRRILVLR